MFKKFLKDESGAHVVEYALIIAIVSIALVLALQPLVTAADLGTLVARIVVCLSGSGCV
ncbi:Flp/Fap pilin component [compost metagenome]|uniref:Flp family type IVb pilin n=1 Tax=Variovorax boronicumulans TaxID=436515 RepID=UPI000BB3211D|nr:Flp family type IVb pilin [Variovorax boronicumulans]PBI95003.1 Flp/Fap pilin component [Variovorax boronicumulans]